MVGFYPLLQLIDIQSDDFPFDFLFLGAALVGSSIRSVLRLL